MVTIDLTYYWYLIIETDTDQRIIKYSKSVYELLSLFRREIESKIYNPSETWLFKNNPTRIILASIPIESLCLNPSQITMEIIEYYGLESIKQYTIATIDSRITLLHNCLLVNDIIQDSGPNSDIDIELCLLDLIADKLAEIYKLYTEQDEHIYKLYDSMNIQVTWNKWFDSIFKFDCLFYPPIEEMRKDLINLAFQTTFIKYNPWYNKDISYFDLD